MDLRLTGALVVVLATLGASVKVIPTECPENDLTDHVLHLAHESDCTKFYKCDNGKKVLFDCPIYNAEGDKLYFNVTLEYCDWPEKVNCGMPSTTENNTDSTTPSPIDGCIGSCPFQHNDPYPDRLPHKDCTKFCLCSDFGAEVHHCPPDRPHWDNNMKRCAKADETPCSHEYDDDLMDISRSRDRFIW